MNRFYYILMVFCAFCTAVALPSRAHAGQEYYPAGLQAKDLTSGIYMGNDPASCCWLGAKGAFSVRVPGGADTLLITVVEPDYAVSGTMQSLKLQVNGGPTQVQCCFGRGQHEFSFALARRAKAHTAHVRVWAGRTFVPKEIGLNGDPRRLSMLIAGVAFVDSTTGLRLDTPSGPTLQSAPLLWLVVAGAFVLLLTLRRPIYGAAAIVLTDPFLLAHSVHGTTITLPKVALIAVAAGLLPRLRRTSLQNGIALAILLGAQALFVLSMAASSVHAADHGAALRETLKAAQYAATLIVAYLAYRLDPDEHWIRLVLSVATVIVAALAIAQEFVGAPQRELLAGYDIARIAGPLEGPNQLSSYLGVLVPAMLAFAITRPAIPLERIAIALGCLACLLTFSKAGIAALAIAIVFLLVLRYAPRRAGAMAAASAAAFAVLFVFAGSSFAGVLHGSADKVFGSVDAGQRFNGGLGVRSDLWHAAYALWRSHPVLGIGPGNFELSVGRYDPGVRTHANSMYFQVLAEQGIVGFFAMLAVVAASIGVFARRLAEPLALGACAAAVAMAFHQIVDCMWIYPKVGVMWWLLLAFAAAAVDLALRSENLAERAIS
jgi:O-antigen ligase